MSDAVAMSFKARMNNLAKAYGLRPQTVLQNFMFERFLERLAKSQYRANFVIKGGVLITAMLGIQVRTTMDMDATAVGLPLSLRSIRHAIGRIVAIDVGDKVAFTVSDVSEIRIQVEGYGGIRVKLVACFHGLRVPISIDVTKGDALTPAPKPYAFKSSFGGKRPLSLLAYSVETVLAEKCESILKRNVVGTRPRDYYDIYMLTKTQKIRPRIFKSALRATFENCGTMLLLARASEILNQISLSRVQTQYWKRYQSEFPFAVGLDFQEVLLSVRKLLTPKTHRSRG